MRYLMGAHNGLTAKLVREAGFDGVWISGCEVSTAHGVPDESVLCKQNFLYQAHWIRNAVGRNYPVYADVDTGFRGPVSTTYLYMNKGITGICIEDKEYPKKNSLSNNSHQQLPPREFVDTLQKMIAVRDKFMPEFEIIARCESLIVNESVEEALERADIYNELPIDGFVIHDKTGSAFLIKDFVQQYPKKYAPIWLIPTTYYHHLIEFDIGNVHTMVFANQGIRAIITTLRRLFKQIRYEEGLHYQPDYCSLADMFSLQKKYLEDI